MRALLVSIKIVTSLRSLRLDINFYNNFFLNAVPLVMKNLQFSFSTNVILKLKKSSFDADKWIHFYCHDGILKIHDVHLYKAMTYLCPSWLWCCQMEKMLLWGLKWMKILKRMFDNNFKKNLKLGIHYTLTRLDFIMDVHDTQNFGSLIHTYESLWHDSSSFIQCQIYKI